MIPQYKKKAARLLRARLDPEDPGCTASADVRAALAIMEPYLSSYVYPLIGALGGEPVPNWLREAIDRDAARLKP